MYDLNGATEWATSDGDHFGKDCGLHERMQEFYLHEACDLQDRPVAVNELTSSCSGMSRNYHMTGANVSSIKKEEISRTDAASSGSVRQMLTWNLSSIASRFASSLAECLDRYYDYYSTEFTIRITPDFYKNQCSTIYE
ncbi:hypothetical protein AV530_005527 [Patagioenas fasciata monilis]|uniref:Uncharacterized protein n=1 Tax=Patagioenas fasciata monilis TaxID=372326 RepID=A0A1V4JLR7_PATFA|nr:hypothetical protein AV530_005527 [Patagioenas fasciata monilis]